MTSGATAGATAPDKADATVGQLIGSLATDTGVLVRQELHLAATEMTATASVAARNVGFVAAGGALLHTAVLALVAGLIAWLQQSVPIWMSAAIVGLVLAAVGAVLLAKGMAALRTLDPVPRDTLSTLKPAASDRREPRQ